MILREGIIEMTEDIKLLLNGNRLVDKHEFEALWCKVRDLYGKQSDKRASDVIADVLKVQYETHEDIDNSKINHLALYIGDYQEDTQVFKLAEFFSNKMDQGELSLFEYGPSYLAPTYYGTQGWWFSIECGDSLKVELFTFKEFGKWQTYSIEEKINLISHFAVEIKKKQDVKKILDYYSEFPYIKNISYNKDDMLGHTYGHLLNTNTNRIIEFLCQN